MQVRMLLIRAVALGALAVSIPVRLTNRPCAIYGTGAPSASSASGSLPGPSVPMPPPPWIRCSSSPPRDNS